jgi:single-stranded DNA-binding protein
MVRAVVRAIGKIVPDPELRDQEQSQSGAQQRVAPVERWVDEKCSTRNQQGE